VAEVEAIRIDGLKQFQKALKAMSSDLPKALRIASNNAANIIVADAKPKVPTGPGKGGHAADSVKAASTQTAARVQGGGNKYPYYPWLDFGGSVGRKKHVRRPFFKRGRYIWASFADNQAKVVDQLTEGITSVAEAAGLKVGGE
jgi:hypothetical protein